LSLVFTEKKAEAGTYSATTPIENELIDALLLEILDKSNPVLTLSNSYCLHHSQYPWTRDTLRLDTLIWVESLGCWGYWHNKFNDNQ